MFNVFEGLQEHKLVKITIYLCAITDHVSKV